jgi:hypothetical protein
MLKAEGSKLKAADKYFTHQVLWLIISTLFFRGPNPAVDRGA